jgi:DGQHR domain-containing protein
MAYVFEAVKGRQKEFTYFNINLTYGDVANLVVLPEDEQADELLAGMQRPLTKTRVKPMAEYLQNEPNSFYSSLTLILIPRDFSPVKEGEGGYQFTPIGKNVGTLSWDADCLLFTGDGQHRGASIIEALKGDRGELSRQQIPVILIPYTGDPDVVRQLFSDLNRNAKPVSKTIALDYDTRDFIVLVSKAAADQIELFRNRINKRSNSLSKSSPDVIAMNTLYEGSAELMEAMLNRDRKKLAKEKRSVAEIESIAQDLVMVWSMIIDALPGWADVMAGKHPGELREDVIYGHGLGWQAIARATAAMIKADRPNWKQSVPKVVTRVLGEIDWSKTAEHWEGIATSGGNVNNTFPGVKATAGYILEKAGTVPADPKSQSYLDQLGAAREQEKLREQVQAAVATIQQTQPAAAATTM